MLLGKIFFSQQVYDKAFDNYSQACKLDPENPNYAKDRDEALTELNKLATPDRVPI